MKLTNGEVGTSTVGELKKWLEDIPDSHLVIFEHEDELQASYSIDEFQNENGFFVLRSKP